MPNKEITEPVQVPEAYAALGFSGLFHLRRGFTDETTREAARCLMPCLVNGANWLLVDIDADGMGVLVRKDTVAIVEAYTNHRGSDWL